MAKKGSKKQLIAQLYEATEKGDLELVKHSFEALSKSDQNVVNKKQAKEEHESKFPLHIAIEKEHNEIIAFFCKQGGIKSWFDGDSSKDGFLTPLECAVNNGNHEVIKKLKEAINHLFKECEFNIQSYNVTNLAFKKNDLKTLKCLFENGINKVDYNFFNGVLAYTVKDIEETLAYLNLKELTIPPIQKDSLLKSKNTAMIEYWIKKNNMDVNQLDQSGETWLYSALKLKCSDEVIEKLFELGADPNQIFPKKLTENVSFDCLKNWDLVRDALNAYGIFALRAEVLFQRELDPNHQNNAILGQTLLFWATHYKDYKYLIDQANLRLTVNLNDSEIQKTLEKLLEAEANPNQIFPVELAKQVSLDSPEGEKLKNSKIMAYRAFANNAELLLKKGLEPNNKNNILLGYPLLYIAAQRKNYETVRHLVDYGANYLKVSVKGSSMELGNFLNKCKKVKQDPEMQEALKPNGHDIKGEPEVPHVHASALGASMQQSWNAGEKRGRSPDPNEPEQRTPLQPAIPTAELCNGM